MLRNSIITNLKIHFNQKVFNPLDNPLFQSKQSLGTFFIKSRNLSKIFNTANGLIKTGKATSQNNLLLELSMHSFDH